MSLASDFGKCFGEGLAPYGFVKMKGADCFGRLVNGEILLYVLLKKMSPPDRGKKAFDIIAGVQTVYSCDLSAQQLGLAGLSLFMYGGGSVSLEDMYFVYEGSDMSAALDRALGKTVSAALPELMKIDSLKACLDFLVKYRLGALYPADEFFRDSVLLYLTDNHDSFEERLEGEREYARRVYAGQPEVYESYMKQMTDIIRTEIVEKRDRVWASESLRRQLKEQLDRRSAQNREQLEKYGLLK